MNPKENLLEVLNWGSPEYVPISDVGKVTVGFPLMMMLEQIGRAHV